MKKSQNTKITAVILCAGSGQRTGLAYNKILHYMGLKTVLETTIDKFKDIVGTTICVCSERDKQAVSELAGQDAIICIGGETRTDSVRRALDASPIDTDIIIIHDGARPFVTREVIEASITSAAEHGSGIAAVQSVDAVKYVEGDKTVSIDKSKLFCAQTPQTFRFNEICSAYEKFSGTAGDDCEVYEKAGYMPSLVPGDYGNIKITTAGDLLKLPPTGLKIGAGFDVHRFAPDRKLILGGVTIPYALGLIGHSDADVLTHAVMDAVLSAAELPDIGVLFPDTDMEYKDADSIALFKKVIKLMIEKGYVVRNISAVVMAEQPKLSGHIGNMRACLSNAASIRIDQINISATTTEKLGIVGEGKGIAASCSCLLEKK